LLSTTEFLEQAEFRKAMGELRAIWVAVTEYLTRAAPWTQSRPTAPGRRWGAHGPEPGAVFAHLDLAGDAGDGQEINEAIQGHRIRKRRDPLVEMDMARELDQLEAGQPINPPDVLFAKIAEEQVWSGRAGSVDRPPGEL